MRIGIDLGGTKIEGIVLDNDGEVLQKLRVPTPKDDYDHAISSVSHVVKELESWAGKSLSVGIGTPGTLSKKTGLLKNCNSICLNHKPVKQDLEAALDRQIIMANDANCFALSEAEYGSGKDATTVFGVILGTGAGGGLVVNKQVITGPNSISGEWGHIQVPRYNDELFKTSRECYCGRLNCIEAFLCGKGLAQTYSETTGDEISGEEIARLASQDNENAKGVLALYCDQLAAGLSTIINIVDPDVIVFGGGLSNIDAIYQQVPERILHYIFSDSVETKFAKPTFGDASGARGAACLWPLG